MDKKFFGLIIPNKSKKYQPKLKSIFDSDEDESESSTVSKKVVLSEFASSKLSNKNKLLQKKLAEDDPTIYEYDSVYDSLKQNQAEKQTSVKKEGPKYISSLLKAAEKRKKEQERRQEKKIQNERDKEGDEFKDKEGFVTSAYKQKMLEMQAEEERENLMDQIDDMMDVTKQKDLSGFYRHYLKQTVGEEAVPEFGARDAKVKELTQQASGKDSSSLKTVTRKDAKSHSPQNYEDLDADSYGSSEDDDHNSKSPKRQLNPKSQSSLSSNDSDKKLQKTPFIIKEQLHSKNKRKSGDKFDYSYEFKASNNNKKSHKTMHSNMDRDMTNSSSEEELRDKKNVPHVKSKSGKEKREFHSESIERSHSDSKRKHIDVDSPPKYKPSSSYQFNSPNDEESHHWHKTTYSNDIDKDISNSSEDEMKKQSDMQPEKFTSEKVSHSEFAEKSHLCKKRKHNVDSSTAHDKTSNGESELSEREDSHHNDVSETLSITKTDITAKFAKRTIDEVFDQAQTRYFKRMATRKIG